MSDNTSTIPEGFPGDGLDDFTRAYIECALWSETDNADESGGEPLDKNYGIDDLAPEALARMSADCARFQHDNEAQLEEIFGNEVFDDPEVFVRHTRYTRELAGHDFWLTRNGHGAGFWDRGLGEIGDKLTEAAQSFKECNLIVGDDGQIHHS